MVSTDECRKNHEEVLRKMRPKRTLVFKIRKKQLKFLKEGLANLILTGRSWRKENGNLPYDLVQIDSRIRTGKDSKGTNVTWSYNI